jgi:5'-3' exonuclease
VVAGTCDDAAVGLQVHLVDGTYELFRHYFAVPSRTNADGEEVGAVRGVVSSMLALLGDGATHVGVATDHVIESWRNDLWDTYKDGTGIDPVLFAQFPILEEALEALGLTVWAMVEDEADDALGAAARVAEADERVERVLVCTPDKDLGQVVGGKIVQFDRRKGGTIIDADGVRAKFGVDPESIPDYLALVGDSADGFPGIPGWGAKTAGAVLARYKHLEAIPGVAAEWDVAVRGVANLVNRLNDNLETALLFRRLATLNCDCEVGAVDEWAWNGPTAEFEAMCERLDAPDFVRRANGLAAKRLH